MRPVTRDLAKELDQLVMHYHICHDTRLEDYHALVTKLMEHITELKKDNTALRDYIFRVSGVVCRANGSSASLPPVVETSRAFLVDPEDVNSVVQTETLFQNRQWSPQEVQCPYTRCDGHLVPTSESDDMGHNYKCDKCGQLVVYVKGYEMTRDEIMQMSPDELRVAVAKAKGWRVYIVNKGDFESLEYSTEEMPYVARHCPDWPASITDAYTLEDEIPAVDRYKYTQQLNWIINQDTSIIDQRWELIHASPLQRSQAWLMWKREEE